MFPKIGGTWGGPHNKDHSILRSRLGSAIFGKLLYGELVIWENGKGLYGENGKGNGIYYGEV